VITPAILLLGGALAARGQADDALRARAQDLARQAIIVDTHIDVPDMLRGGGRTSPSACPTAISIIPAPARGG